ncbi:MAG: endonuclease III [Chlorobi bacterium OLB5]|nr:MAG: endonuclease III [Chlorobi bacterium OLB5]
MNRINTIIKLLQNEFPGFEPQPAKADPLDVLIATKLSQNTTDKTSYRAFTNLKNDFRNWDEVMDASPASIRKAIRVCGLVNTKTADIKNLLKQMNKKYGKLSLKFLEKLDDKSIYEELLQYKGIGVKTISCVLAFSLGRDVLPVDTHVHRVMNRLGIVKTSAPEKTFEHANLLIPKGKKFLFHTLLIRFGRKICRSANPLCGKCSLYDLCEFKDKENYALKSNAEPKENNFIILEHI